MKDMWINRKQTGEMGRKVLKWKEKWVGGEQKWTNMKKSR